MGKDKTGQRRKGHAQPSSSGRTAEMLGSAPLNPFLSFSSLKETLGKDDTTPDPNVDPNFQLVLKKMSKKDSLTKLKALQEFQQLCKRSEADAVVAILPFWPRLYTTLASDLDHRIREATQLAHCAVLSQVKKSIAPHLKLLAGPWFVAQCDTYAPAATAASQAFRETFPEEKLSKAIAHCQDEILNFIIENLIVHTPQTVCNPKLMTADEMESKYLRIVTSSLQGYCLYLGQLTRDQLLLTKELNRKLVSDQKFWKLSKHSSAQVRSAWFRAIISLCQNAQFVLDGEEKRVGLAVFSALDESEAVVLPVVWEAALVTLVTLNSLWETVSFDKLVLPKLLRVCQEAGYGCAAVIFPSLLPLLSKMPKQILNNPHIFYNKLFSSIKAGFSQRSVQQSTSESKAVATAFVECLQYVLQQNQDNGDLCSELMYQQLLPLILSTLVEQTWRAHVSDALYSSTSRLLHDWGRSSPESIFQKLLDLLCSELAKSLKDTVMLNINSKNPEGSTKFSRTISVEDKGSSCVEADSVVIQKSLSCLLNSEVNFIMKLLKDDSRPQKVKFSDECVEISLSHIRGQIEPCEYTVEKISAVGRDLCCWYLTVANKLENVDFLPPIVTLTKILYSQSLFSALASAVSLSSERALYPDLFSSWLKPDSVFLSRSAVTLSSLLLCCLPVEDQNQLLNSLLEHHPNPTLLLWMVEEGILPNGSVASWVRSPDLIKPIKELTETAVHSDENDLTWALLLQGAKRAGDGDHVFCCGVLQEALDVIVKRMEAFWVAGDVQPSWIHLAVDFLQKLFLSQAPFFVSLPDPHIPLSTIFQFSLLEQEGIPKAKSISSVWKDGVQALASIYGPSSPSMLLLCSELKKNILALLSKQVYISAALPERISLNLSDFILTLSSLCSDVNKKTDLCSLLMNELFCQSELSDNKCESDDTGKLFTCLQSQRTSLQKLANWVHPENANMTDFQTNISGSQMSLVPLGYWGCVMVSVIERITEHCSAISNSDLESEVTDVQASGRIISTNVFMESFFLFSDVHCVVSYYLSTEVGSAMRQPCFIMDNSLRKMLGLLSRVYHVDIHNVLNERKNGGACWSHAHKIFHIMVPTFEECSFTNLSIVEEPPTLESSFENINLLPLKELSRNLRLCGSNDSDKTISLQWLSVVHRVHVLHGQRLLLTGTVDSASPESFLDAYYVTMFLEALITYSPDLLESRNWDQVMVALASWIHSLHETVVLLKNTPEFCPPSLLCIHLRGVCRLFVALNKVLIQMQEDALKLNGLEESLPREWGDVFAGECEHKLLAVWTTFVENINSPAASPCLVATLDELGLALQHSTLAFLTPSKGAPVKYQPLLDLVPPFLLHNLGSVRLAAYHLLLKVVPHMVQSDAEMLAAVTSKVESGDIPLEYAERLTLPGFEDTLVPSQTVVSAMLSDIRLGCSCTVQPFTDAYTYTCGYLYVWSLMLEMCKVAETELRYQYAIWMKNVSSDSVELLFNNVFRLLPEKVLQPSEGKKKTSVDIFTKKPSFSFHESWNSSWIEGMACSVLFEAMGRLPALARQWWKDCEPKSAILIDRVVSEYLSPTLCLEEMAAVAKMQDQAVDNMVVRVHPAVREVVATYTVDDLAMELIVRLPFNHPLSPMIVEIGKRDSAASSQWRQWLMQLTMFLTHQNGSLWDGLALWRNNVVRRYEGVEECYICFCVLSGPNFQLPKLSCRTCRKKFHSNCLYKWFQTSNKSTCPICRNLF